MAYEPAGLKGNRLQIRLAGPYSANFLANRMTIGQKIGEICPRPAEFCEQPLRGLPA